MHEKACADVKTSAMQKVKELFDVVITSNSGYPLDQNLYQTVKGMSAAAQIIRENGIIICAAECKDGIPDHGEYGHILRSETSPEKLLKKIMLNKNTTHDQWQVQIQAQIQTKAKVILKSSGLSKEQIEAAHLRPINNITSYVKNLIEQNNNLKICVLPQGPMTIPYL